MLYEFFLLITTLANNYCKSTLLKCLTRKTTVFLVVGDACRNNTKLYNIIHRGNQSKVIDYFISFLVESYTDADRIRACFQI